MGLYAWLFSFYILYQTSPQHSLARCASTYVHVYITNKFSYKSFPYFLISYHAIMVPVVPSLTPPSCEACNYNALIPRLFAQKQCPFKIFAQHQYSVALMSLIDRLTIDIALRKQRDESWSSVSQRLIVLAFKREMDNF